MSSFPWNNPTSRTTGIASESISDGAGYVGSEIDNSINLDDHLDVEVVLTPAVAPSGNTAAYLYLLYSDGSNYEDGGVSVQPVKVPVASILVRASTSAQRVVIDRIPIPPKPLKIMVWNGCGQSVTATVTAKSYRGGYSA